MSSGQVGAADSSRRRTRGLVLVFVETYCRNRRTLQINVETSRRAILKLAAPAKKTSAGLLLVLRNLGHSSARRLPISIRDIWTAWRFAGPTTNHPQNRALIQLESGPGLDVSHPRLELNCKSIALAEEQHSPSIVFLCSCPVFSCSTRLCMRREAASRKLLLCSRNLISILRLAPATATASITAEFLARRGCIALLGDSHKELQARTDDSSDERDLRNKEIFKRRARTNYLLTLGGNIDPLSRRPSPTIPSAYHLDRPRSCLHRDFFRARTTNCYRALVVIGRFVAAKSFFRCDRPSPRGIPVPSCSRPICFGVSFAPGFLTSNTRTRRDVTIWGFWRK